MTGRPLNVAVVGLGRIGSALVRRLTYDERTTTRKGGHRLPLHLVTTCARTPKKYLQLEGVRFTDDFTDVLRADNNVDVVVEAVGGTTTAADVVHGALNAGKHVVTNNRVLMASQGETLMRVAQGKGVQLRFEGAVLGGVPCLDLLCGALIPTPVTRLVGVLNATCNFALQRMLDAGDDMATALAAAVELGQSDDAPTVELSGKDTLHKLRLLRAAAFGRWDARLNERVHGLEALTAVDVRLAWHLGYRIKLLGVAEEDCARVAPYLVDEQSLLAHLTGPMTGLVVETSNEGPLLLAAQGSDPNAVVGNMLADLLAIQRQRGPQVFAPHAAAPLPQLPPGEPTLTDTDDAPSARATTYYLRLATSHRYDLELNAYGDILAEYKDEKSGATGVILSTHTPRDELFAILPGDDKNIVDVLGG